MKKRVVFIMMSFLLIFLSTEKGKAQLSNGKKFTIDSILIKDQSNNTLQTRDVSYQLNLNIWGYSSVGSINVERIQGICQYSKFSLGAGIGMNIHNYFIIPDFTYKYLTLPHQASLLLGSGKSHIQLGIGGTYLYPLSSNNYINYPFFALRYDQFKRGKLNFSFQYSHCSRDLETLKFVFIPISFSIGIGF